MARGWHCRTDEPLPGGRARVWLPLAQRARGSSSRKVVVLLFFANSLISFATPWNTSSRVYHCCQVGTTRPLLQKGTPIHPWPEGTGLSGPLFGNVAFFAFSAPPQKDRGRMLVLADGRATILTPS